MKQPEIPSSYPVIARAYRLDDTSRQESETLPAEVRVFYDPLDRHSDEPDDVFLDGVAATRATVVLPGIGQIGGHEVVAAEVTHAMIDGADRLPLKITDARRESIKAAVAHQAGRIALKVVEATETMVQEHNTAKAEHPRYRIPTLPPQLVLSGKVMAAVAHENVRRRSGRLYYYHPDEVSSIFTVAWRKQFGAKVGSADHERMLDVIRFLSYAHDAYEDSIDSKGAYLAKPVIMTPLVAEQLLEIQHVADARNIARTLLFMTRTEDENGKKMPYRKYIDLGIKRGGEYFILTKSPDIKHNVSIEPDKILPGDKKSAEKVRKRNMYLDAVIQILRASDPYDTSLVAHSVFQITRGEVAAEGQKKYNFNINDIAQQVHREVMADETPKTA